MNNLTSINTKNRKRVGRGISAGGGMTAGRGTKGQKSRAGHNIPNRFEGGQTPISMRLSKFKGQKINRKNKASISFKVIVEAYSANEEINLKSLAEKKLIKNYVSQVKIYGTALSDKKLKISPDIKCSKSLEKLIQSKTKDTSVKKK